ncbi:TylF/MycF family methyltransferase [Luminiphilus sp.]|nr:TylF/MycF family methyltransferase [Luminiphilus sp.]
MSPNEIERSYIDLLIDLISGKFNRENGLRINYLLECFDSSSAYDLGCLIDIVGHNQEKFFKIKADLDEEGYYKERIFGFPYSMIGRSRLLNIERLVRRVVDDDIEGDFVEAGVWRGGACILARLLLDLLEGPGKRKVVLMDSFEGLPESTSLHDMQYPFHLDKTLAVGLAQVRQNLCEFGLADRDDIVLWPGYFEKSLRDYPDHKISILRADGDLYSSTTAILDNLFDNVSAGGFVVVDDYGALDPCKVAVDQFLEKRGLYPQLISIDWTGVFFRV